MKSQAAVLEERGKPFVIKEIEVDEPIGQEVLVETAGVGLCASDIHLANDNYGSVLPAVLGHEITGVVKQVGPEVTELKVGDRVVGTLIQFCGRCEECVQGRTNLCLNPAATLRGKDERPRFTLDGEPLNQVYGLGAFSQYTVIHQNQLVKLEADIPAPQAAILGCGVITGLGGVINAAQLTAGDTVAVFGAGGVGLNVVSGARLAGAGRIIVVDLSAEKLELAKKFGATDLVNASEGDPVEKIKELTGRGVDHAFEVIGLGVTQKQAIKSLAPGGGAYFIGLVPPGRELPVDVFMELIAKQAKVQGVYMGASNIKHDIPLYASLYEQGRINLDDLISQELPLEKINEGYEQQKNGEVARSVITSF